MFLVAGAGGYRVMPGGLTRVSPDNSGRFISMQRGGSSKDLWVASEMPVERVTLLHSAGPIGSAFVHIGWGLNATLAGSVSLLLSGVAWFLFVTDEADEWRKRAAAAPVTTGAPVVPAGWYRDPNDDAMLRYWNGFGWTTQTAKPAS